MLRFFELNSIRHRMLSGFLFLTLLIVIVGTVSIYLFWQVNRMANTHQLVNQLQIYTLNLIKTDNDFLNFETTNEKYFENHTSAYLRARDSLHTLLAEGLGKAENESRTYRYPFLAHLVSIDSLFFLYNEKFYELESLVYERGFKDFGLEGVMRDHAHALEKSAGISLSDVLSLRRHEKDFLLRHDTLYFHYFNIVCNRLVDRLQRNPERDGQALLHLEQYQHYFNRRVQVEQKIGLGSHAGVRHQLNVLTENLSKEYFELTEHAGELYSDIQQKARIFYVAITVAAILFSVISGIWISRRLSEPIAKLSRMVNAATQTGAQAGDLSLRNAAIEINELTGSFIKLIDQTQQQMREIKDKSALLKSRNEELNKLNEELDNFLYSAAHDLRSPLSSLLGIVRLMKIENKQAELVPYLEMMQKSIQRQDDFIAQIVSYAKNNKLEVVPERLDLKEMLVEIFQSHEFVAGASEIEKFIHVQEDVPFYSDKNRIHIIFNNLVSNAIRYADVGKTERYVQIRIHVRTEKVTIQFEDNGVGIEPQHLSKIFNMFYRASFESKGSGLGLFIFKEAINKIEGHVRVDSKPGTGTTFFIELPNLISTEQLQTPQEREHVAHAIVEQQRPIQSFVL